MGMNPQQMNPIQKAMMLGGGGLGIGGAVAGSPMVAGIGGLGALAGALPHLQTLMAGYGGQRMPNMPGARNEFMAAQGRGGY
jgi:hypothetical protein